ncbi:TPA: thioredoxin reductase [Candidatus Falkowbacteria bacterium]|nr:thioredoxin reductase [Candidatus Falkowbacteria bacterium]
MDKYDVIIIGGACAGMSAALYTSRRALKTLVVTTTIGGQLALTTEVENYPGILSVTGPELARKLKEQAEKSGAMIKIGQALDVIKAEDGYVIKTSIGDFEAKAVILAFGLKQRQIGVPGEKELTGRGVAYCATCDAPFFKNKKVGVVGGGNSAFDAAEYLSRIASEVHLFVRSDKYRAEQTLVNAVQQAKNIVIHNYTDIKEFIGSNKLEKVMLVNNQSNEKSELALDGVFIEIGWESQTKKIGGVADLVKLDERGYVVVDNQSRTSTPGIYAAGDVTDTPFKQAVISAGEGAKAAMSAAKYLQQLTGVGGSEELRPDWVNAKRK